MVSIDKNQRFGYHKDTPFIIEDSKTGKLAMEFNRNTKAILTAGKGVRGDHGIRYDNPRKGIEAVPGPRIFTRLSDAATPLDNQKKVMLLFSKTAQ